MAHRLLGSIIELSYRLFPGILSMQATYAISSDRHLNLAQHSNLPAERSCDVAAIAELTRSEYLIITPHSGYRESHEQKVLCRAMRPYGHFHKNGRTC